MSESGVHTHNAFALLDDEAPAKQSKPKEVKEEAPKKEVKRTSDRDRPTPRVEGGDRRTDGGHVGGRGGRGGRGGGRGGARGGHTEGGRERKEFDAHVSRSGKTHAPKKDGAGKFNEGSVRDVIADGTSDDRRSRTRRPERRSKPAEEEGAETKVEGEEGAAEATTAEGAPAEEKPVVPEEPAEPPTKTYTEFLASQKKLESDLAIQVREVQNDESQFKAVKVIAKTEEKNPYITTPAEEKEKAKKAKKDKAKHISLDEFTAAAAGSFRGGARGRGARDRGRRGDSKSLVVNDSNFPSIASKEKK